MSACFASPTRGTPETTVAARCSALSLQPQDPSVVSSEPSQSIDIKVQQPIATGAGDPFDLSEANVQRIAEARAALRRKLHADVATVMEDDRSFDFVLIGAGHFQAGVAIGIRQNNPDARILVVESRDEIGGAWLDANMFSFWQFPLPVHQMVYHYYMHSFTKLPVQCSGLAMRDDVLLELLQLYAFLHVEVAVGCKYLGTREGGRHELESVTDSKRIFIDAPVLVWPRYRAMNSFNDVSTRHDSILRLDLSKAKGVCVLGNSLQAAESINFVMRAYSQLPIKIIYRTARLVLMCTPVDMAAYERANIEFANCKTLEEKVNVTTHCIDQVIASLSSTLDASLLEYIKAFRHRLTQTPDELFSLKQMALFHWKSGAPLEFQYLASVDNFQPEDGWALLDCRNDTSASDGISGTRPSAVAGCAVSQPTMTFANQSANLKNRHLGPIVTSVVATGLAFSAILAHHEWLEPMWDAAVLADLQQSFHYYQRLARNGEASGPALELLRGWSDSRMALKQDEAVLSTVRSTLAVRGGVQQAAGARAARTIPVVPTTAFARQAIKELAQPPSSATPPAQRPPSSPPSCLVLLRNPKVDLVTQTNGAPQDGDGTQPSLVIAPSFMGDESGYEGLWRSAAPDRAVYALRHLLVIEEHASFDELSVDSLMKAFAAALVAEFGPLPFMLIGTSFGCLITNHLAPCARAAGATPRRLVLIDPHPNWHFGRELDPSPHSTTVLLYLMRTQDEKEDEQDRAELDATPAHRLGHFLAARALRRGEARGELEVIAKRERCRILAAQWAMKHMRALVEGIRPFNDMTSGEGVTMMAFASERVKFFSDYMGTYGLDDKVDGYGRCSCSVTMPGDHLEVAGKCMSNRAPEFTMVLERWLRTTLHERWESRIARGCGVGVGTWAVCDVC